MINLLLLSAMDEFQQIFKDDFDNHLKLHPAREFAAADGLIGQRLFDEYYGEAAYYTIFAANMDFFRAKEWCEKALKQENLNIKEIIQDSNKIDLLANALTTYYESNPKLYEESPEIPVSLKENFIEQKQTVSVEKPSPALLNSSENTFLTIGITDHNSKEVDLNRENSLDAHSTNSGLTEVLSENSE